ncbi:orf32 [Artaxa digramma nucleopolyhedrovirus]|uniref:Orf32 n=1 Tax=Artaxa digramma nucleopolyhedrovirus TaxID=3070910 RepID=A0AAE6R732_9ABAC|nr:orf32 [Euproctis digramma nucleopolyhedrovirus]QHB21691.1 orf32 [Artaxa digramma nucleopolyhedrovirus]
MSSLSVGEDNVLDIILKNNISLIDNTYIVLNVVDKTQQQQRGQIQTVCIGKINSIQTAKESGKIDVSVSSVTSELPSD